MEKIIKLTTVNIKALSRKEIEKAYIRLLKVSKMKTKMIEYLQKNQNMNQTKTDTALGRDDHYAKI